MSQSSAFGLGHPTPEGAGGAEERSPSPLSFSVSQIPDTSTSWDGRPTRFTELLGHRHEIDADFGEPLRWDPLEGSLTSVIRWDNPIPGGYRDDPDQWETVAESLADAMTRLVAATAKPVAALTPYKAEHEEPDALASDLGHGV